MGRGGDMLVSVSSRVSVLPKSLVKQVYMYIYFIEF